MCELNHPTLDTWTFRIIPDCLWLAAQVLYKMDKHGDGQLICLEDLSMSRDPSFVGFTYDMFVEVRPLTNCLT